MKRVLIVDDDANIRQVYGELLASEGFEVLKAASAEEATEILIRTPVDLVLLDINMPDVDGIEMREVLEEYDDRLKVIIASVFPVSHQQRWIRKASDYFDKAQGIETLLQKIRKIERS